MNAGHQQKMEMELEKEERQQKRNLQPAIEYLEKYGHGAKIEIENNKDNCTWGEDCAPSTREGKNSDSLKGRQNKYQSYCYEFQKMGPA